MTPLLRYVGSSEHYDAVAQSMSEWITAAFDLIAEESSDYPLDGSMEDALANIIGFSKRAYHDAEGGPIEMLNSFHELVRLLPEIYRNRPEATNTPDPETNAKIKSLSSKLHNYVERFDRFSKGRYLCRTRQHLLAWVPDTAEVGDHICAFQWCAIPFVLRPASSGYTIVGDAYVHNYMTTGMLYEIISRKLDRLSEFIIY
jgi:hypothetical protein